MELCSKLPAAPLKRAIVRKKRSLGMSWEELGNYLGVTERTLQRLIAYRSIGVYSADHMAIRLGLHPTLLWPKEWTALVTRGSTKTRGGDSDGRAAAHEEDRRVAG
jgi:cyanate lyase